MFPGALADNRGTEKSGIFGPPGAVHLERVASGCL
jgi:hypothetical protein